MRFRFIKLYRIKKLGYSIVALLAFMVFSQSTLALSQAELHSIYNDSVWYNSQGFVGNGGSSQGTLCTPGGSASGGSTTSSPYLILTYPNGINETAAAKSIENFIDKQTSGNSPWLKIQNFGSQFVAQAKQLNINPYIIVAIGNQETNLGLTGSGRTNNNSFGEKIPGTSTYRTWPSFEASLFGSGSYTEIFANNVSGKSSVYKDVTNVWEYLSMHLLGQIVYPGDQKTFYDAATGKTIDVSYLQIYYSNVKKWIGEMTNTTINDPPPTSPGSGGGGTGASCSCSQAIIATAMSYAWPTYRGVGFITLNAAYQAQINDAVSKGEYTGGPPPGVDCGAFVIQVMRDSGADPSYADPGYTEGSCATQCEKAYLDRNSNLYESLGTRTSTAGLQPGDIAITANTHTFIYTGNQGFPNSTAISASQGDRAPMASDVYFVDVNGVPFSWYRIKCPKP